MPDPCDQVHLWGISQLTYNLCPPFAHPDPGQRGGHPDCHLRGPPAVCVGLHVDQHAGVQGPGTEDSYGRLLSLSQHGVPNFLSKHSI